MSDYAFVHEGKAYTPNGTQLPAESAADHNAQLERAQLAQWQAAPAVFVAYYHFPAEHLPLFGKPRPYRERFTPLLHTYVNKVKPSDPGIAHVAHVTTWPGTRIGTITSARVYRHNFGGRFVALRVRGTNGAEYHGRASWDRGDVVTLRRVK